MTTNYVYPQVDLARPSNQAFLKLFIQIDTLTDSLHAYLGKIVAHVEHLLGNILLVKSGLSSVSATEAEQELHTSMIDEIPLLNILDTSYKAENFTLGSVS